MCQRQDRGLEIAACSNITKKGDVWVVPSQTGSGKYVVSVAEQNHFCNCPDFELRGQDCKHVFAVLYVLKREQHADGSTTETLTITKTKRPTFGQKWTEYNQAQVSEKDMFQKLLRSLCDSVKEPSVKPGRGRPRIPMSDCVFMSAFKVYSTVSQRRFMCDLDDATQLGYLERTPHFNAISSSLEDEAMTPVLLKLIQLSSLPLKEVETDFAVDATGFMSSKFVRWFDHKYGKTRQEHTWVKLHAACGVKTNVITAVEIREKNTNDCPLLPDLINRTAENFTVSEVSADKQYASETNFQAINALGADGFIPFRSNTTGERSGELFRKAFFFFNLYREDFLKAYHKRSNVESTFSMIKRKFGDSVRSKTTIAMSNEVYCKVLAHNICCLISAFFELGIEPTFLNA